VDLKDIVSGKVKNTDVDITEAARQLRIREDTERLRTSGAKAKRADIEQNFFERHTLPELTSIAEEARARGKPISIGNGLTMSPRSFLAKVQEEQVKLDTIEVARAESAIEAGNVFASQVETTQIIARASQGQATPETTKAFGEATFLNAEFQNSLAKLEQAKQTNNPSAIRTAQFGVISTQAALVSHQEKVKTEAITREQATLVSDPSKLAAADWIGSGRFANDLTAAVYIDEVSQIGTPEMIAAIEKNPVLQEGISAFLTQLDLEKQKQLGDVTLNPEGELDMNAVMASMFAQSKSKPKIADMTRASVREAVIERDGEQITIKDAIVDSASRFLVSRGVAQMVKLHENEPEVVTAINSVLTSQGGFIRSDLNNRAGLLNVLAAETAKLQSKGIIDSSVNLATEIRRYMADAQTYVDGKDLFVTTSPAGAGLNKFIFANNMESFIGEQIQRHWRAGANDDVLVQQELERLQAATTARTAPATPHEANLIDKIARMEEQQGVRTAEEVRAEGRVPSLGGTLISRSRRKNLEEARADLKSLRERRGISE